MRSECVCEGGMKGEECCEVWMKDEERVERTGRERCMS